MSDSATTDADQQFNARFKRQYAERLGAGWRFGGFAVRAAKRQWSDGSNFPVSRIRRKLFDSHFEAIAAAGLLSSATDPFIVCVWYREVPLE